MDFHARILPPQDRVDLIVAMGPSTNDMQRSDEHGARHNTPFYEAWKDRAMTEIVLQLPSMRFKALPPGNYCAGIMVALETFAGIDPVDLDNRLKAIFDLLHRMRITPDDKWLYSFVVSYDPRIAVGYTQIGVWPLADVPLLTRRPEDPPPKKKRATKVKLPSFIGRNIRGVKF
jgi:hypothetical protein